MYWADLSRLPGFVPQIVAELFTLLFDLVRVGGQAVGIYAASPGTPSSLGQLARWHRIADQLYTRALATLMLQLGLCALVVVLASAVAARAGEPMPSACSSPSASRPGSLVWPR